MKRPKKWKDIPREFRREIRDELKIIKKGHRGYLVDDDVGGPVTDWCARDWLMAACDIAIRKLRG